MNAKMLIQAEHIYAGYAPRATDDVLKDIGFSLHENERLGIVGPNGCGKTTLLRVLAGVLPYRGSLMQTIRDPASLRQGSSVERSTISPREAARETGLLSQLSAPWFSFSVYDTVMLGRYARQKSGWGWSGKPTKDDVAAVEKAIAGCGLTNVQTQTLSRLSGGQLQRVYLARVFAQNPTVLLLDEPTNHLDLRFQLELLDQTNEWLSRGTHAVIGVFHDLSLAFRFADTVILLEEGRIVTNGTPETVIHSAEINRVYQMDVATSMRQLLQNW